MTILKIFTLGFVLLCVSLRDAAAETAVLLIGKIQSTGDELKALSGGAKAIIKGDGDQIHVSADAITFDAKTNVLVCAGESAVTTAGRTIKGKDISIELGTVRVRVLSLDSRHPATSGTGGEFDSWKAGAVFAPLFNQQMPEVRLDLAAPNAVFRSAPTTLTAPRPARVLERRN